MDLASTVLQFGLASGNPLVQLLVLVVGIGLVVLVGRIVLKVAWRLVTIAAVVIGLVLLVSMFLPGLL
jgi:amino acid permease